MGSGLAVIVPPRGCNPGNFAYGGDMLRVIASRSVRDAKEYYGQSLKREDYYTEGQEIRASGRVWQRRNWDYRDR